MDGNNTGGSTVFVVDDGKILSRLLHLGKQNVRSRVFGNEVRLIHRLLHRLLHGGASSAEELFNVKHADDIVNTLAVNGIIAVS